MARIKMLRFIKLRAMLFSFRLDIYNLRSRSLFSPSSLGIDGYIHSRKRTIDQLLSFQDKFKSKMKEYAEDEKSDLIFTEDLKNILYIASRDDIELVLKMIRKFSSQSAEHRFGSFTFGPVVMRMFHHLDLPNEALQSFYENVDTSLFDQLVSIQILLDMLYNSNMFKEIEDIFELVKIKKLNMTKYPKHIVTIVMASCNKQNTIESFNYAMTLWKDMVDVGSIPTRQACTLFAMLALKQGAPHIAVEVLTTQNQNNIAVRAIKAMGLANYGSVEDALVVLKSVLYIDSKSEMEKQTIFVETIECLRTAVKNSNKKDLIEEFKRIEKALIEQNLITYSKLDDLLCSEVIESKKSPTNRKLKLQMSYRGSK